MSRISADDRTPPPLPAGPCHRATAEAPFALVIDDEESIRRNIATALGALGVGSASFPTAKLAIAALDQLRPAIIFLDVALDQSDAIDVIKGLSAKRYGGIVQLMSGGKPWLLAAIQRMATHYGLTSLPPLQKPIDAEMVRESLTTAGLAPAPTEPGGSGD